MELFREQTIMTIFETTKKYLSVEECGAVRYSLSAELKKKKNPPLLKIQDMFEKE